MPTASPGRLRRENSSNGGNHEPEDLTELVVGGGDGTTLAVETARSPSSFRSRSGANTPQSARAVSFRRQSSSNHESSSRSPARLRSFSTGVAEPASKADQIAAAAVNPAHGSFRRPAPTTQHNAIVPLPVTGGPAAGAPSTQRRGAIFEAAPTRPWYSDLWLGPCAEVCVRFAVLFAVGANVLAFPYLLAFEGAVERGDDAFAVLSVCDALLWLDWLLIFVTPIWDEEAAALRSHRAAAASYLRSADLVIDLVSRCPWDALVTGSSTLSFGHLARLLTIRRALSILHSRVGSGPRFVGPLQRLVTLCTVSLIVLHWYTPHTPPACLLHASSAPVVPCMRGIWAPYRTPCLSRIIGPAGTPA